MVNSIFIILKYFISIYLIPLKYYFNFIIYQITQMLYLIFQTSINTNSLYRSLKYHLHFNYYFNQYLKKLLFIFIIYQFFMLLVYFLIFKLH